MKEEIPFYTTFKYCIIVITIILILIRVMFYFIPDDLASSNLFLYTMQRNRDLNFRTLYNLMDNGLFDYYNPLLEDKAIYLYFWYFIYYPFYLIPFNISVYIWDMLRLISILYIAKNINKITENKKNILFFFAFSCLGYFADMYLNNTNWLIELLIFESYLQLKKDNQIISGILFSLAMYKIIILIFPIVLLISKKMKLKSLIYFFIPLTILCIPYIIFPNYFLQMASNWYSTTEIMANSLLLNLFLIMWRLIQPAHLLFISLIVLILIENIKSEKWKPKLQFTIYLLVFIIWVLIWLFLLIIIAIISI